jgi:prepilin signal peptidase PulO-like enzyme (type II secretory pathway)
VLALLLVARRITLRTYVPFGPFLILGAYWAVLVAL